MTQSKHLLLYIFAIMTVFFARIAYCEPVITTVSGTFTSGKTVTLQGSSFGASGPNIILYDNFDGGTPGLEIPLSSPIAGTGWSSTGTYKPVYSSIGHSGSTGMLTYNNGATLQFIKDFEPTTEAFVSFFVRIPDGTYFPGTTAPKTFSSGGFWKMVWLMDGDRGYNSDNNIILGNFIGANTWTLFTNNDGFNMYQEPYRSGSSNWWNWDGWMRHSYWIKSGVTPEKDPGNAYIHVLTEGLKQVQYNGAFVSQGPNPYPVFKAGIGNLIPRWTRLNVPGYIAPSDVNTHPIYDDVYLATGPNARARIDIGDNPSYSMCRQLALSIPTSWTDTQISFTAQYPPGLKAGDTAYVFVFDSNGVSNTVGYPVKVVGRPITPPYLRKALPVQP